MPGPGPPADRPLGRTQLTAFAALAAATVGAFFLVQHLKTKNPYINGFPRPDPAAINPVAGRVCRDRAGDRVSFRRTNVSFYLDSRSQTVDVLVYDSRGDEVAAATGSGRYMRLHHRATFSWDGRLSDGSPAPDGTYYFHILLPSEGVNFPITGSGGAAEPIQVITQAPRPDVTSVTEKGSGSQVPVISPLAGQQVTIHYTPDAAWRDARIEIIRTGLPGGGAKVVYAFGTNQAVNLAGWKGNLAGRPAPAGTYLIGMRVTDAACNVGYFPIIDPPPPGATPHAGLMVRYLAAEPPLVPTPAGSDATVFVDSRLAPYRWQLRLAGQARVLEHGAVGRARAATAAGHELRVRLPGSAPGLYELQLSSGAHRTAVPLVAAAGGRAGAASRILVVLPALSWQGANPVDDTGDGLPTTLAAHEQIELDRPLVDGLPADVGDELGLLAYLRSQRDTFQLTTDVALAEGLGPTLSARTGVVLDGTFTWLPQSLESILRTFVSSGGRLASIGTESLEAVAPVHAAAGAAPATAGPPAAISPDPFGVRHGPLTSTGGALITVLDDHLGIFGQSLAFSGFSAYEQLTPPAGAVASSEAGVATGIPAIAGFRLGRGDVVEVGLPGFGTRLAEDVDAQGLVAGLWRLLSS